MRRSPTRHKATASGRKTMALRQKAMAKAPKTSGSRHKAIRKPSKAVSALVDKGTPKEQIDYAKVRDYWENSTVTVLDLAGNPIEKQMWGQAIKGLYDRFPGTQDEANAWLDALIKQQASDAIVK